MRYRITFNSGNTLMIEEQEYAYIIQRSQMQGSTLIPLLLEYKQEESTEPLVVRKAVNITNIDYIEEVKGSASIVKSQTAEEVKRQKAKQEEEHLRNPLGNKK